MQNLYFGGKVLTMEQPGQYAEAVLTEEGRILAAGGEEELRAIAPKACLHHLKGAVLMPGFIDAHSHFSQVASGLLQVSLEGAGSVSEMTRRIAKYCKEKPVADGDWVIARDYDNNLFPDGANPPLSALDLMAEGHPLVIQHKSGHMGLFNSAALAALGLTPDSPVPQGGKIEVKGGRLTGYLEENSYFAAQKKVPMPGPSALISAYEQAQQKYASYGITTMQEGMIVAEMLPLLQLLVQKELLWLDLVGYPEWTALRKIEENLPECAHGYYRHFRIGGMKIFLDGSPQGRTAWMRRPYLGDDSYCGYGTMSDDEVTAAMDTAAREGRQLLAHCNGDAAAAQMLRCLSDCERRYPSMRELRPVMIHAQLLGRDQIAEAAFLGVIASFFVAHVYHWGEVHRRNFGEERASRISPAASALQGGLRFTLHQDAPVIEPDMLETVWCAVNRLTAAGNPLGEEERISPWEALRALTINAAYQYGEEQNKGTLSPGKRADFVVLSADPLTVSPEKLRDIHVLQTIKDGKRVYGDAL